MDLSPWHTKRKAVRRKQ